MDKNSVVKQLTNKIVNMITIEINKKETQVLVKEKIIIPIINMIYREIYPYVLGLVTVISIILFLTLSTFVCFIMFYVKQI